VIVKEHVKANTEENVYSCADVKKTKVLLIVVQSSLLVVARQVESVETSGKLDSHEEQKSEDHDEDLVWLRMNIYNVGVGV
jgi:hypothetical protein